MVIALIFVSMAIVPIVCANCRFRYSAAVAAFCACSLIAVSLESGWNWLPLFIVVVSLVVVLLAGERVKNSRFELIDAARSELNRNRSTYADMVEQNSIVIDINTNLSQNVAQLSDLFDSTKEMSMCMTYEELLKVAAEALRKRFSFTESELILLGPGEDTENTRVFLVRHSHGDDPVGSYEETGGPGAFNDSIVKMMAERRRDFYAAEDESREIWGAIPEKSGIHSVGAVPLIMREKLIGALVAKGLDRESYERFLIFSNQLALQVERVSLYEEVQRLARYDALTGVFVRRHFLERLEEEFERSARHGLSLSVLMVDIDHFKTYNDRYGHLVGDMVLKEVASVIRKDMREIDIAGRLGGEEFAVFLPETLSPGARSGGERIRAAIDAHTFKAYDEVTRVTVSVGTATCAPGSAQDGHLTARSSEDLLHNADKALYEAKRTGRNKVCAYSPPV